MNEVKNHFAKDSKYPEGKSLRSQFWEWLEEICPGANVENYCHIMADSPGVLKVRIFTHDYRYSIVAKAAGSGFKSYLGCQATRRKPLAGETQYRGADLPDGLFTRVTWERIKDAILRFELVKITASARKPQWKKMRSHYEIDGEQFYGEWLQRGDETREHKSYKLFATGDEGIIVKSEPKKK